MLSAFRETGLPRSPSSCDYSSDMPEGFCCDDDDDLGWRLRPGLGQHNFERNAGECVDHDDNPVEIPPNTYNKTFGYTCVVLGHKWTLKKDTGGQCHDTYQHFFMNKGNGVNCKKGRHHNFVRDATINKDSDICALRGGVVDGYCWDKLNEVDGYYLRPGITIRDAKSSSANNRLDSSVNVPTCALETCCAGPATTNSKGIEQEHLERPENLDISSAFLKPLDSETTYMHTFVCDERISFDGFRPRQSELRSSALESKQSVLRQLDPCIKCLSDQPSAKFCVRGVRAWCSSAKRENFNNVSHFQRHFVVRSTRVTTHSISCS